MSESPEPTDIAIFGTVHTVSVGQRVSCHLGPHYAEGRVEAVDPISARISVRVEVTRFDIDKLKETNGFPQVPDVSVFDIESIDGVTIQQASVTERMQQLMTEGIYSLRHPAAVTPSVKSAA